MPLNLEFPDKYRLWNALVRGNTDRLFVATNDRMRLGSEVSVQVRIAHGNLPIVISGVIVGVREKSRRFPRGYYLRIPTEELEKSRRFLGLQPSRGRYTHVRHALRVHHEFPVRYSEPASDDVFTTKNVSETGMFVTCPSELSSGQQVRLYLVIDDMPLPLSAEIVWLDPEKRYAGLHITDITDRAEQRLREAIENVHELRRTNGPTPPILVADDDQEILRFMTTALSKSGYDVFHAANGDDALDMIRELHPELVVMDILMAGTDGAEICKLMRSDAELADIKVVFVSALAEEVLHSVADEAGANDYLAKPLRLADLTEMVSHYLSH
jgi:CheY-like chemotaxis protein